MATCVFACSISSRIFSAASLDGEYKYFSYPLPDLIAGLRPALYGRLYDIANHWNEAMGIDIRYPDRHEAFLKRCHAAGQTRQAVRAEDQDHDEENDDEFG